MLRFAALLVLAFGLPLWACSPKPTPVETPVPTTATPTDPDDYAARWRRVDSLRERRLPQSALEEVNAIYALARRADNEPQEVKSLLYRVFLERTRQANDASRAAYLGELRTAVSEARSDGARALLESILGEAYERYTDRARYQIQQRTPLLSPRAERPVDTWSLRDLEAESNELFLRSTQYPATRAVSVRDYDALLSEAVGTDSLRPTLYDFLAARAIAHLLNTRQQLTEPAYAFRLNDPVAYAPVPDFARWQIETPDTASAKRHALLVMQAWLVFRAQQNNPKALLDADLKRLELVHQHYTGPDKNALYAAALQRLETTYADEPLVALATYQRATLLRAEGNEWQAVAGEVNDSLRLKHRRAVELCRTTLLHHPGSLGAQYCQRLIFTLREPYLQLEVEHVNLPGAALPALVSYRNVTDLHLRVVRIDEARAQAIEKIRTTGRRRTGITKYLRELPATASYQFALPDKADYRIHRVEVALDALPVGRYALLAGNEATFGEETVNGASFFAVSQLGNAQRTRPAGGSELVVFDRENGQPVAGATVQLFATLYNSQARRRVRQLFTTKTTDARGRIQLDAPSSNEALEYRVIHQNDTLNLNARLPTGYRGQATPAARRTVFYLDRGIYRPGQTVYYKAVLLENDAEGKPRILPNQRVEVQLLDVNRQEVAKQGLTSNDYGSVQGSFVVPAGGLTGRMRLQSAHGNKEFRVEEYKRPKFQVSFEPVTKSYRLSDSVRVMGSAQAYAGAPVDGATVRYTVTREVRYPYWWFRGPRPTGGTQQLAAGTAVTDARGNFAVSFVAVPAPGADLSKNPLYQYRISADVVDRNGETRSATTTVRVGSVALSVSVDLPATVAADSLRQLQIFTSTLNGERVTRSGTLQIRELEPPKRIFKRRYWEAPDLYLLSQREYREKFPHLAYLDENEARAWPAVRTVLETDWQTGTVALPRRLAAGTYLFVLATEDRFGNAVKHRQVVQVYDAEAERLPAPRLAWLQVERHTLQPGDTLRAHLASSLPDLPVLVELARGNELLHSEWLTARQWATYTYPVTEADRGGLSLQLTYAQLGRSESEQIAIEVPWKNKELTVEYLSFRDKLKPGAEETWTLRLSGPDGEAAAAELVATLYDASLDAFQANRFAADWWPTRRYNSWLGWRPVRYGALRVATYTPRRDVPPVMPRRYRTFDYRFFEQVYAGVGYAVPRIEQDNTTGGRRQEMLALSAGAAPEYAAADVQALPRRSSSARAATAAGLRTERRTTTDDDTAPRTAPPVRENLEETVFFFPQLRTDAAGRVLLEFTMNEALTEWKLLGMAHTKGLQTATTERTVVTQKELMVLPNVPRFVREGDEVVFSSKLNNLTDRAMAGTATLQLVNPLTDTPVYPWQDKPQFNRAFTIEANASAVVEWRFKVPPVTELPLLQHTTVATAGPYSDGERAVLPVLTNRTLVTETLPLPVAGKSSKTFTFNSFANNASKTLSHEGMTLELTSNPAWYAVQALPYLMEHPSASTEQLFSRYYANTLASSIANRHPRVKRIYAQWKAAGSDALVSNLAKNEALKTTLLAETPWVMAARSETEQKQRIGLLFDLNRMAQEQRQALTELRQRQQAGGGWPWMPGGPDNWYISQYLVEGLAHLRALGATETWTEGELDMLRKAVAYLDREAARAYAELERDVAAGTTTLANDHLSPVLLHYLYTRSYFLRQDETQANRSDGGATAAASYFALDKQGQKVFDYYTGQAERYWTTRNLMEQAMAALTLHRLERPAQVDDLLRSFRERALHDEELGMYYQQTDGYYWYQLPVRTHVKMIEVFDEVAGDEKAVNALKVWLLKNKQTTHWKTTKATAAAVYAFLSTGTDWLAATAPVRVSWQDGPVQVQVTAAQAAAEAGTGYFKTRIDGAQVSKALGTLTVDNPNDGPAWGALYWQYLEDIDRVKSFKETPLTLERQLFRVRRTATGEALEALDDGSSLRVGDRVRVRVLLRVDRALEYVHLKDARAAGFEPLNVLSTYNYRDGLGYYESTTDAATNFFIAKLRPGNYVFEYSLNATLAGDYSHGVTSIQCVYAPEYSSHSEGMWVTIE